jgi:transposase
VNRCVGLDVHKSIVQSLVLDARGREVHTSRFPCSKEALVAFAQRHLHPSDRVVLEATTNTWGVVRTLKPFVKEVLVSNPLQTKAIAWAKIKTDKVDARVLAQLLRADYLPLVWQPPEDVQIQRSITSRRAALIADRTAIKNRIHAVLRERLIAVETSNLFRPPGWAWLRKLSLDVPGRQALDSDMRLLEGMDREIEILDAGLLKASYMNEDVKLLVTLPGVDVAVAQTVLAVLGDMRRFKDPDHAASYVGLVPSTRQSADKCYHGPITKHGNSRARWMLVQAAQKVGLHPGPLGAFFRRVAKRRGRNIAVVATARKLVVIAWHMLTKREPYRYAQPEQTQAKLRRIRLTGSAPRRCGRRPATAAFAPSTNALRPKRPSRRIPALSEIYASEDLPPTRPLATGERRMLKAKHLQALPDMLNRVSHRETKAPDSSKTRRKKNRKSSPKN